MSHYADLLPCDYLWADATNFKAVGWLAQGRDFPTGEVSEVVFEKLCELLVDPWNPAYPAGFHSCELCRFTGGIGQAQFKNFVVSARSACSLLVPGDGFIYVSPSSISHYIDAHGYQPPEEFCEAVLHCPPMRSTEYFKALLNNGARDMVRASQV